MENKLIINYIYMDDNKNEEWLDVINQTSVNLVWLKTKFRIEIKWNWGEEKKVEELMKKIMTIFGDPEIVIENNKDNRISLPEETKTPISTIHEEKKEAADIKTFEKEASCEKIEEKENSKKEENGVSAEENNNVISKEDNVIISSSPPPLPPEEKNEIPKPDYEKAIKDLFGDKLSEYNFDVEEDVNKFCNDFKIKSEALRIAIIFSNTSTNEMVLSKALGRYFSKNAALAKVELRKSFEKWMKEEYSSFIEMNQGVNVFHFLNVLHKKD